jgi:Sec-independent protein secretion pathway component TatC
MLAKFIPLVVLYEASIPLARMVQPKKKTEAVRRETGDDYDDLSRAPA